ncbi:MAG TPA: carboxypeptidase-like regulatory domain-containing protein, partial [Acidobacteriota bacterium]|nr:carboxypeptidase-like regulatory domain-containing protein [Acidobacteriota bacterium]
MPVVKKPTPVVAAALCLCCIGLVLSVFQPETVFAQVLYGTIVGNIKDASGAVVPGAAVSAMNKGTNVTFESVT